MNYILFQKITAKSILLFVGLDLLRAFLFPTTDLIYWGGALIFLDLVFGVFKSLIEGKFVFSEGVIKTIKKLSQYFGTILVMFVLTNLVARNTELVQKTLNFMGPVTESKIQWTTIFFNDLILIMICYAESLSICENLIGIDPKNWFSRFVLKPFYYVLSMAILANPLRQYMKNMQNKETKPT